MFHVEHSGVFRMKRKIDMKQKDIDFYRSYLEIHLKELKKASDEENFEQMKLQMNQIKRISNKLMELYRIRLITKHNSER